MGKRGNKVCYVCKQDVSRRYRLKDAAGRYYCDRCFAEMGTKSATSHQSPLHTGIAAKASAGNASPPLTKAPAAKTATKPRARKIQPVMREAIPTAHEEYRLACKSVSEIVAAADNLLTLWSEFLESSEEKRLERHPEAVERRDQLFAATRKWLDLERQRLGIDDATADLLENGENPFDATSAKCFLR